MREFNHFVLQKHYTSTPMFGSNGLFRVPVIDCLPLGYIFPLFIDTLRQFDGFGARFTDKLAEMDTRQHSSRLFQEKHCAHWTRMSIGSIGDSSGCLRMLITGTTREQECIITLPYVD